MNDNTWMQMMGQAMVGDIPENYTEVLNAWMLSDDYELLRSMGLDHELAWQVLMEMEEDVANQIGRH